MTIVIGGGGADCSFIKPRTLRRVSAARSLTASLVPRVRTFSICSSVSVRDNPASSSCSSTEPFEPSGFARPAARRASWMLALRRGMIRHLLILDVLLRVVEGLENNKHDHFRKRLPECLLVVV